MAHLYVVVFCFFFWGGGLKRFDLGTLDSGERSLPFGLLVFSPREIEVIWIFVKSLDV